MPIKKREGLPPRSTHRIKLAEAVELVQRFQRSSPASEKGGFFWADAVRELLAQKGVVGLRYYHGTDENGGYRIVLVGVDKDGKDIVRQVAGAPAPTSKAGGKVAKAMIMSSGGGEGDLLQEHYPCPPWCPPGGAFA